MLRSVQHPATVALLAVLSGFACTEAKQASAPDAARSVPTTVPLATNSPLPSTDEPSGTTETEVDCDPDKDFAKLDFPADIATCIQDQGRLYNYDMQDCTDMNVASTFDCDVPSIKSELKTLGLSSAPLDKEKDKGGKLIACGASNNGFVIVAQFFYKSAQAPKNDCSFSKQGKVVSICFRRFATETPPPPPATAAEKQAYIEECLDQQ